MIDEICLLNSKLPRIFASENNSHNNLKFYDYD